MTHPLFRKEVFVDYVDTYQGQNAFSSFNEVRKDGNQHRCTSGGDSASARGLFHSKALWFPEDAARRLGQSFLASDRG